MTRRRWLLRNWWMFFGGLLLAVGFLLGRGLHLSTNDSWQAARTQLLALDRNDIPAAVALLKQMPDPIERGLAAEQWVSQNRGHTDLALAIEICKQLTEAQAHACERHLSSAHLRR